MLALSHTVIKVNITVKYFLLDKNLPPPLPSCRRIFFSQCTKFRQCMNVSIIENDCNEHKMVSEFQFSYLWDTFRLFGSTGLSCNTSIIILKNVCRNSGRNPNMSSKSPGYLTNLDCLQTESITLSGHTKCSPIIKKLGCSRMYCLLASIILCFKTSCKD